MGREVLIINGSGAIVDYVARAGFDPTVYPTPRYLFDLDLQLEQLLKDISTSSVCGIVLVGGADVDNRIYTKSRLNIKTLSDALELLRTYTGYTKEDMMELLLARYSPKPVFGFCRGFQELHVALSNADWSPLVEHMPNHYRLTKHSAKFIRDVDEFSFKAGDTIGVNSLHHQGVYFTDNIEKKYPRMKVLAVSGTDPEDTVEIATWKNFAGSKALGVQYHPEFLCRELDFNFIRQTFA